MSASVSVSMHICVCVCVCVCVHVHVRACMCMCTCNRGVDNMKRDAVHSMLPHSICACGACLYGHSCWRRVRIRAHVYMCLCLSVRVPQANDSRRNGCSRAGTSFRHDLRTIPHAAHAARKRHLFARTTIQKYRK